VLARSEAFVPRAEPEIVAGDGKMLKPEASTPSKLSTEELQTFVYIITHFKSVDKTKND
jgi:hypothetical protein